MTELSRNENKMGRIIHSIFVVVAASTTLSVALIVVLLLLSASFGHIHDFRRVALVSGLLGVGFAILKGDFFWLEDVSLVLKDVSLDFIRYGKVVETIALSDVVGVYVSNSRIGSFCCGFP